MKPKIICLCGSTKFKMAFEFAGEMEALSGHIVLAPGIFAHFQERTEPEYRLADDVKARLDELHLRKIDLADEVFVINVGNYIGESTRRELNYARQQGKRIRFLEACDKCVACNLDCDPSIRTGSSCADEG